MSYKVNDNLLILVKYKKIILLYNGYIENIPRKDIYYKDEIRINLSNIYKNIVKLNSSSNILYNEKTIYELYAEISYIIFLSEILLKERYISEKNLEKIMTKFSEINKMLSSWVIYKTKDKNDS